MLSTTANNHLTFEGLFGGLSSGIVIINIFASQKLTTLGNYNTNIDSFLWEKSVEASQHCQSFFGGFTSIIDDQMYVWLEFINFVRLTLPFLYHLTLPTSQSIADALLVI